MLDIIKEIERINGHISRLEKILNKIVEAENTIAEKLPENQLGLLASEHLMNQIPKICYSELKNTKWLIETVLIPKQQHQFNPDNIQLIDLNLALALMRCYFYLTDIYSFCELHQRPDSILQKALNSRKGITSKAIQNKKKENLNNHLFKQLEKRKNMPKYKKNTRHEQLIRDLLRDEFNYCKKHSINHFSNITSFDNWFNKLKNPKDDKKYLRIAKIVKNYFNSISSNINHQ